MQTVLLTPEEEVRLVHVAQGADPVKADAALGKLLTAFSPQIVRIARNATRRGLEFEDAEQIVRIAAMHAIRTLDSTRGGIAGRLRDKAKAALQRATTAAPMVRTSFGSKARSRQNDLLRAENAFRGLYGRDPNQSERERIYQALGTTEAEATAYMAVRGAVRMDHTETTDNITTLVHTSLHSIQEHTEAVHRRIDIERLREVISLVRFHRTDALERRILDDLLSDPPLSAPAMAAAYGVPIREVRRVYRLVLDDVRSEMMVGMQSRQTDPPT